MPGTDAIVLDLGERSGPVVVEAETVTLSRHTGRSLRVVSGIMRADDRATHEMLQTTLNNQAEEGISGTDHRSGAAGRWRVALPSWSVSAGQYRYQVTLTELESLTPEALVIDGIEFIPLRFKESATEDGIDIVALAHAEGDALVALRQLIRTNDYFPVVRRGISGAPVLMRFGRCGWSSAQNGRTYHVVLVDKRRDDASPGEFVVDYVEGNAQATFIYRAEFVERLARLLVQKGILSEAELKVLHDEAEAAVPDLREKFYEVPDVEKLWW